MKIIRRRLVLLLMTLLLGRVVAAQSLYQVTVPLADRGGIATEQAIGEALQVLLVRLTGSRAALDNPALIKATKDAKQYLLQYSYLEQPVGASAPSLGAQTLYLDALFQQRQIDALLKGSGEAMLPPNRPSTLAWLMVDTPTGRDLLTPDTQPALAAELQYLMDQHALTLRFPANDMIDLYRFPPHLIWSLNVDVARAASARYGASAILLGRIAQLSDGRWIAQWTNLLDQQMFEAELETTDPQRLAQQLADGSAAAIASRFAIRIDPATAGSTQVAVEGISSLIDFRSARVALERLGSVNRVQLEGVEANRIRFRLFSEAGEDAVLRELALVERLTGTESAGGSVPHFRWQAER